MGQGCVHPGDAKATFGTGAFLDVNIGGSPPPFGASGKSGERGCFPIIAWERDGTVTWGVEAVMLSAGTALSWLVDDVGILTSPAESAEVAGRCTDTGDVFFVPALIGLGTPNWDFGARTLLIGMTSGTGRPELVRAVLRGIAQRGADLLEAAEFDAGLTGGPPAGRRRHGRQPRVRAGTGRCVPAPGGNCPRSRGHFARSWPAGGPGGRALVHLRGRRGPSHTPVRSRASRRRPPPALERGRRAVRALDPRVIRAEILISAAAGSRE